MVSSHHYLLFKCPSVPGPSIITQFKIAIAPHLSLFLFSFSGSLFSLGMSLSDMYTLTLFVVYLLSLKIKSQGHRILSVLFIDASSAPKMTSRCSINICPISDFLKNTDMIRGCCKCTRDTFIWQNMHCTEAVRRRYMILAAAIIRQVRAGISWHSFVARSKT